MIVDRLVEVVIRLRLSRTGSDRITSGVAFPPDCQPLTLSDRA
jgi:hypothetical protein